MLTIDHVRAFIAEAGGKHPPDQGNTNGIDWRLGPGFGSETQTTCPDCFREITSGMTIYRPEAMTTVHGRLVPSGVKALYVCAACFDWDTHVKPQYTRPAKPVGAKGMTWAGAAKRLDKITREEAPRFRVTAPQVVPHDNPLAMAVIRAEARLRPLQLVA